MFEHVVVFRKSPQNLCVVFKQRSESPQISAILRKTCANNAEQQLKKTARKISQTGVARFVLWAKRLLGQVVFANLLGVGILWRDLSELFNFGANYQ